MNTYKIILLLASLTVAAAQSTGTNNLQTTGMPATERISCKEYRLMLNPPREWELGYRPCSDEENLILIGIVFGSVFGGILLCIVCYCLHINCKKWEPVKPKEIGSGFADIV